MRLPWNEDFLKLKKQTISSRIICTKVLEVHIVPRNKKKHPLKNILFRGWIVVIFIVRCFAQLVWSISNFYMLYSAWSIFLFSQNSTQMWSKFWQSLNVCQKFRKMIFCCLVLFVCWCVCFLLFFFSILIMIQTSCLWWKDEIIKIVH